MTHNDDERFEAFLAREAKRVTEPQAEVPREAMWEAIAQARAARRVAPSLHVTHAAARRLRYAPWMGMAATLLLGVGIGGYAMKRSNEATRADTAFVLGAPIGTAPVTGQPPVASTPVSPTSAVSSQPGARRVANVTQPVARDARQPDNNTYSIASQQHLTRAEALVAVVAAMPQDATMDSLTARWAKDVLSNTRLLLDSPAGDDPVRRRLLEDLETVLVQLVQRSGRTAEDRDMLDRTLQKTQILTRLRSRATGT